MSDEVTRSASETASEQPATGGPARFDLNIEQVANLACNLLAQGIVKAKPENAKDLFKKLKKNESLSVGSITINRGPKTVDGNFVEGKVESLNVPVSLSLNYSEFRGQFGFPLFQAAVRDMLNRFAALFKEKKELNILTNQETGAILLHHPGVIRKDDQYNVLVLAIEPRANNAINLALFFVDPDQYESLRSD